MRVRFQAIALAAVIVAGTVARFDGITFGLPYWFHPDESIATGVVSACSRGEAYRYRYRHPPLLLVLACATDRALVGVTRPAQRWLPHELLSLRIVSAVAGSAAIGIVYLVALRFVPATGALGAAFLFACFPAAVAASKYGTPDSLLLMLVLLALWLQLRASERDGPRDWLGAALATTLAVAAKYNAAFLAFSFLAAWIVAARSGGRRLLARGPLLATGAGIVAGLAIGLPSVLFGGDFGSLAGGLFEEQDHLVSSGHFGFEIGVREGLFVFHFRHSILPAAGPLLLALIVGGLVAMAVSRRPAAFVLLAFALPYYAAIEWIYKVPPSYERYVLPLVGVYIVAASLLACRMAGLGSGTEIATFGPAGKDRPRAGARQVAVFSLIILAAASFPLWKSGEYLASIGDDTRTRMAAWMHDHAPEQVGPVFAQWAGLVFYYPQCQAGCRLEALPPNLERLPSTLYVLASSLVYERFFQFPDTLPEWTAFYTRLFAEGELLHEENAGAAGYMFNNPVLRLYRIDGSKLEHDALRAWRQERLRPEQREQVHAHHQVRIAASQPGR